MGTMANDLSDELLKNNREKKVLHSSSCTLNILIGFSAPGTKEQTILISIRPRWN